MRSLSMKCSRADTRESPSLPRLRSTASHGCKDSILPGLGAQVLDPLHTCIDLFQGLLLPCCVHKTKLLISIQSYVTVKIQALPFMRNRHGTAFESNACGEHGKPIAASLCHRNSVIGLTQCMACTHGGTSCSLHIMQVCQYHASLFWRGVGVEGLLYCRRHTRLSDAAAGHGVPLTFMNYLTRSRPNSSLQEMQLPG